MTPSPDFAIPRHLATRTQAIAAEIGISCCMTTAELRSRLAGLEYQRLVVGWHDGRLVPSARVFTVTGEDRQKTGAT